MVPLDHPVRKGMWGSLHRQVVYEGPSLIALIVVVIGHADDDLDLAVAVDVAGRAHRVAEIGVSLIVSGGPVGGGGGAAGGAVVDIGLRLVRSIVVRLGCADDDVVVAVAVHVPGRPHRVAEVVVGYVPCNRPSSGDRQPGGRASVEVGPACFVRGSVVILTDDDVVVAVAVHIPGRPHCPAQASLIAGLDAPVRGGRKPSRRAVVDTGPVCSSKISVCANDHIVVAVIVDVPGRPHRVAKLGVGLVALGGPVRGSGKPPRRAVVDIDAALVVLAVVIFRRADDDVVIAIAVDVPGRPHRVAKLGVGLVALGAPGRGGGQAGWGTVIDVGPAFVLLTVTVHDRADDDVVVAVAVDVPRRPHRVAQNRQFLIPFDDPGLGDGGAGRRAVVDIGAARIPPCTAIVLGRTDDDVGKAVAVHVPRRCHRVAQLCLGLVALDGPAGGGGQGVHGDGVDGVGGIEDDADAPLTPALSPRGEGEAGGEGAASGVVDAQFAVAQDAHAEGSGELNGLAVGGEVGGEVAVEGQFEDDFGTRSRRRLVEGKALLQAPFVVHIPPGKGRVGVLVGYAVIVGGEDCRPDRLHRVGTCAEHSRSIAVAGQCQAPLPGRGFVVKEAGDDPHAVWGEIGAQVVGTVGGLVGRLHAIQVGPLLPGNAILGAGNVLLHCRPPVGGDAGDAGQFFWQIVFHSRLRRR